MHAHPDYHRSNLGALRVHDDTMCVIPTESARSITTWSNHGSRWLGRYPRGLEVLTTYLGHYVTGTSSDTYLVITHVNHIDYNGRDCTHL